MWGAPIHWVAGPETEQHWTDRLTDQSWGGHRFQILERATQHHPPPPEPLKYILVKLWNDCYIGCFHTRNVLSTKSRDIDVQQRVLVSDTCWPPGTNHVDTN